MLRETSIRDLVYQMDFSGCVELSRGAKRVIGCVRFVSRAATWTEKKYMYQRMFRAVQHVCDKEKNAFESFRTGSKTSSMHKKNLEIELLHYDGLV